MATVESLNKLLDNLDVDRGHFTIEDYILACPKPGESQLEAMFREHPFKTIDPAMLQSLLKDQSPEDWS